MRRLPLSIALAAFLAVVALSGAVLTMTPSPVRADTVTVYKSPYCGCCKHWVDHMRRAGFTVRVIEREDVTPDKVRLGVPPRLGSCHTATVNGYTIEGHVPAQVVRRLLSEKPKATGIAVPGMPAGSPGMEVPGGHKDRYDVILFGADGKQAIYSRH